MSVCVVSDGKPGHFNQSLGLLALLDERAGSTVEVPKPRSALKHLVLLAAWLCGRHAPLLRRLYRAYYGVDAPAAAEGRFVLSTGGDTLVANVILARLIARPNVFLGKRSPLTDRGVALVFAMEGRPLPGRVVVLDFGPMNVPVLPAPPRGGKPALLAVLVGGDSNEYAYDTDDYTALADALNQLCATRGLRLLLTTSRRTGVAGEQALRARLAPEHLADATWYHEAPRPVTRDYCTRADAILCSEDSGTMLTESIHYGRPVFSFRPRRQRTTAFYRLFLGRLAAHGVVFSDIAGVASLDIAGTAPARPADPAPLREAIHALLARQP